MSGHSVAGPRWRGLVGLVLVLVVLGGCANEPTGPATPGATGGPTTGTAPGIASFVYFLVDTRAGVRLARERRRLAGTDAAKAAVEAMIAGPTDPDYTTTWDPQTRVLSVRRAAGVIEVDVSADARRANAGSEAAARMVQQLVYTVTEVLGRTDPVQLLIEGRPAGELWGVLVWDRAVRREPPLDVRMLVQIDSPGDGAVVSSPVTVEGTAAVFEAQLSWRVLSADGAVVRQGTAMTSEGQRFAPYSFTLPLDRGRYVVQVEEDDPSGGQGGTPMTDTRTVTVE
ncbi:Gmad2 immunoglobulin-like domain-containing protein [Nocardioides sp. QY071]|uniref:Gmad2 immunoglobulin-like domain-containing protein n=1 Tax=Nocardioides sp. QY071 TaxID=3044187 RepID=UPI00249A1E43|nr:Gmad2 immunoglobulin-like domain-containing protein [Nocardioides sp. QY071]WGY04498.1 Gmad2 immunoglobulin-like domain-containing protein [Nocardioides sp. QY071]